jgi:hypothetical protein
MVRFDVTVEFGGLAAPKKPEAKTAALGTEKEE